jgi:hypothetical protein
MTMSRPMGNDGALRPPVSIEVARGQPNQAID